MANVKTVIDVSKYNSVTSWSSVASKVDGIIIRVGYRGYSNGTITKDTSFASHIKGAVGAGIPIGVYFFSQAISASEAKAEADYAVDMIKDYTLSLPIFIDSEYSSTKKNGRADSLTKGTRTAVCKAFCEEVIAKGYPAGVYASDDWFKNNLNLSELTSYNIWVARYSSNAPANVSNYVGWQYTSTNTITGVSGGVDTSKWYGNIEAITVASESTSVASSSSTSSTYKAGDKVTLKSTNIYGTSSSTKVASTKTGTFYIWSASTSNNRIRITNSASNVGKSGQITGWVNVSDLSGTTSGSATTTSSSSSSSSSSSTSLKTGAKVTLKSTNIYATSTATKVASTKTGTYYIWSSTVSSGRIRITNMASNVGKSGSVTGWVNTSDLS